MKAILMMFDSLNRRMLPPYGCDWVHAPNFTRLAEHTVTFDNAYVGSMPCMPARREIHTGRCNFLHRSWGPLEPFDDSMPELLKESGVHAHLASDHYHYWEEGGCTYHTRYNTWEFSRGQEGDAWIADLREQDIPPMQGKDPENRWIHQDWVNRFHMRRESDRPQAKTFANGMDFLDKNWEQDNWFLHIETFDPHEPYFVPQRFRDLYPHEYHGPHFDWPPYDRVSESPEQVQHMRYESAALHSMCDHYLGQLLDFMDAHDMWDDTLLIVNTDHGFLLGEHGWWAKCVQPFYNEVAHMPLFVWDPRSRARGERRDALVQTIDLAPTILSYYGLPVPADVQGADLAATVAGDRPVRQAGLYGIHGGHVNVTDGRYVYMRGMGGTTNTPLYEYTLAPNHKLHTFRPEELQDMALAEPFSFTKGCRVLKIAGLQPVDPRVLSTMLFDLQNDPFQEHPLEDRALEARMIDHLVALMRANDAPPEQYERLGLAYTPN